MLRVWFERAQGSVVWSAQEAWGGRVLWRGEKSQGPKVWPASTRVWGVWFCGVCVWCGGGGAGLRRRP